MYGQHCIWTYWLTPIPQVSFMWWWPLLTSFKQAQHGLLPHVHSPILREYQVLFFFYYFAGRPASWIITAHFWVQTDCLQYLFSSPCRLEQHEVWGLFNLVLFCIQRLLLLWNRDYLLWHLLPWQHPTNLHKLKTNLVRCATWKWKRTLNEWTKHREFI